jgi:hypothetical protein
MSFAGDSVTEIARGRRNPGISQTARFIVHSLVEMTVSNRPVGNPAPPLTAIVGYKWRNRTLP